MTRGIAISIALFVTVMGILVFFPGIDVAVSRLFYAPGIGFSHSAILGVVHDDLRYFVVAIIVVAAIMLFWPRQRRAAIFLLLALALGPGLMVNAVFKDHWGRARPAQIVEFGGTKALTPAFVPADQCQTNCSFPAGDPAVGFFLVSAALLVPGAATRRWAIAGAVAAGAALGVVRIAQGGHFLSDVAASGFLVTGLSWALYRAIVMSDGLGALLRVARRPPPALARLVTLTAVTTVAAAASYVWLDRPIAMIFRDIGPAFRSAMAVVTLFGLGGPYLLVTAVAALALRLGGRVAAAWRATYVFFAVAASGLFVDIVKVVAGRARPKLLFADQLYGFTGTGAHADHWSFPSGHSATAAALAVALSTLYPRLTPAWVAAALLIGFSRLALDQHYLSDVLGGLYFGVVFSWGVAAMLRAHDVALRPPLDPNTGG
ncbi:MAG: phosphatase PAP2 family protein [Alphaproteobacteria bacterium]|nr:phosphatase PAP2 family protein [Alphaproteobacteria bacterium]